MARRWRTCRSDRLALWGNLPVAWAKQADRRECFRAVGVDHVKTLMEFMR